MASKRGWVVLSACVGSIIEMYDFVIYGFFASVLSRLYFPAAEKNLSLVLTFVVFAVGYFARPIGGVVFAHVCDRHGRRTGLVYSVIMMGVPALLMALLPTYAHWGVAAPLLLLFLRILQGLSVGGEFPCGVVYLAEHADCSRRGLDVSMMFFGINFGILLASAVGTVLTHRMDVAQISNYGWRIAFAIGGVLALLGYVIRRRLDESPLFQRMAFAKQCYRLPVITAFKQSWRQILQCIGVVCVMAASISIVFLYMPAYLVTYHHLQLTNALLITSLSTLIFTCLIPLTGRLSDFMGRQAVMMFGVLLMFIAVYPLYRMLSSGSLAVTLWSVMVLGVIVACIVGPMGALLVKMFATGVRTTGVAIAYNISFGVFGGLAPVVVTALMRHGHDVAAPAWYLMAAAIVSLLSLVTIKSGVLLQRKIARPLDQLPADDDD